MSIESEKKELQSITSAFAATAFVLWSVFPIHVLGWLVSAIARHPSVENELKGEPVYGFIIFWQGGINMMPPIFLLILFFLDQLFTQMMLNMSHHSLHIQFI